MSIGQVEPWLRGTHATLPPVQRAVVHALELAQEDGVRWAGGLSDSEIEALPYGLPSVAFQMRHIGRSLDRLLTYADGRVLSAAQLHLLRTADESDTAASRTIAEYVQALTHARDKVLRFHPKQMSEARTVGRAHLPTTVGGLLIHSAEHSQRHVGQLVTTAKIVIALRQAEIR